MTERIGILKPDYGFRGGFEILIDQLAEGLRGRGHQVELVPIDATTRAEHLYGLLVNGAFHQWHAEYFDYLTLAERCQRLALDDFDVVVATQPPTWHAKHDNMLGLFFHQGRVFYDLSDEFVASKFADGPMHQTAVNAVRALDADVVGQVRHWLAGSDTTARRLRDYWSIADDKISPYRHPALDAGERSTHRADPTSIAMVSRHEWPKRTELGVAAIHHATSATSLEAIGGGSRLPFVADLDVRLANGAAIEVDDLWLNRGPSSERWSAAAGEGSGRLSLYGSINNESRNALVNNAAAIVAPAYNEDYGLTALEAFAAAKPLIVCQDGGGLTEFVENEVTGLVVEPIPAALADAMDRLVDDRRLAQRLADAGHEHGRTFTIDAALDQFEIGLNRGR